MKDVRLRIASVVGGVCVAAEDGNKLHDQIKKEIEGDARVTLSFAGISRLTTAFLNAGVGQLYGEFSEDALRKHLAPPVDAENWHLVRLKLVVDRAKEFFRNPQAVTEAYMQITGLKDDQNN